VFIVFSFFNVFAVHFHIERIFWEFHRFLKSRDKSDDIKAGEDTMTVIINKGFYNRLCIKGGVIQRADHATVKGMKNGEIRDYVNLGRNVRAMHDKGIGTLGYFIGNIDANGDVCFSTTEEHQMIGLEDIGESDGFTRFDIAASDILRVFDRIDPRSWKHVSEQFALGYSGRNLELPTEPRSKGPFEQYRYYCIVAAFIASKGQNLQFFSPKQVDLLRFRFSHYPVQRAVQKAEQPVDDLFPLELLREALPGHFPFLPAVTSNSVELFLKDGTILMQFKFNEKGSEGDYSNVKRSAEEAAFLDKIRNKLVHVPYGNFMIHPGLRGKGIARAWFIEYLEPYFISRGYLGIQICQECMSNAENSAFWSRVGMSDLQEVYYEGSGDYGHFEFMFFPRFVRTVD